MASVINDNCVMCGACADVCPVQAIKDAPAQKVINPEVCVDCGACIDECPNGAICNDSEADQKWIDYNREQSLQ